MWVMIGGTLSFSDVHPTKTKSHRLVVCFERRTASVQTLLPSFEGENLYCLSC